MKAFHIHSRSCSEVAENLLTALAMSDFKLAVDENSKATELPLLRVCGTVQQNPHMRALRWPPPSLSSSPSLGGLHWHLSD